MKLKITGFNIGFTLEFDNEKNDYVVFPLSDGSFLVRKNKIEIGKLSQVESEWKMTEGNSLPSNEIEAIIQAIENYANS